MLTPESIHWILYDMTRREATAEDIANTLRERGASYEDLVAALIEPFEDK